MLECSTRHTVRPSKGTYAVVVEVEIPRCLLILHFPYLVDGERLERGGTELFKGHSLVLEVNACDGQNDAGGLATGGGSKEVEHGTHGQLAW